MPISTSAPPARQALLAAQIVAEPVRSRLGRLEKSNVGLQLRRVHSPRDKRNRHVVSGGFSGFLDCRATAEHDQVGERDLLPAGLRRVEICLDCFELLQDGRNDLAWSAAVTLRPRPRPLTVVVVPPPAVWRRIARPRIPSPLNRRRVVTAFFGIRRILSRCTIYGAMAPQQ
jgi:hypothetical protein